MRLRLRADTYALALLACSVAACGGGGGATATDDASVVRILTTALPDATAGVAYEATVQTRIPHPPGRVYVGAGTLPPGLALDETTGRIAGFPRRAGDHQLELVVRDGVDTGLPAGRDSTFPEARASLRLRVHVGTPRILPLPVPPAAYRHPFQHALVAAGGTPPYVFGDVAGTWPPGLSMTPEGVVAGFPTAATSEPARVDVVVKDATGATDVATVEVAVVVPPLTILTPDPMRPGALGFRYRETLRLATKGGGAPWTWSQVAPAADEVDLGSIGLRVAPEGELADLGAGPTQVGTFRFSLRVTDEAGQQAVRRYAMTVNPGPVLLDVVPRYAGSPGPFTVRGDGFQPGARVILKPGDGEASFAATFVDATTLVFQKPFPTPPDTAGVVAVAVENPDGGRATKAAAFSLAAGEVSFGTKGFVPSALSSTGLAVGDVDGDGRADLVHAGSASVTAVWNTVKSTQGGLVLHRNVNPGRPVFSSTLLDAGDWNDVALADVDTDGRVDVVALGPTSIRTWLGAGDGTFAPGPTSPLPPLGTGAFPSELAVGRLDADPVPDVAFGVPSFGAFGTPSADGRVYTMRGTGSGAFVPASSATTTMTGTWGVLSLRTADLDGDGRDEVVAGSGLNVDTSAALRFARTDASGALGPWTPRGALATPQLGSTTGTAVGDFLGLGTPSVATVTSGVPTFSNAQALRVWAGADLSFEVPLPAPGSPGKCLAPFDADFDAQTDLVLSTGQGTLLVYRLATRSVAATIDTAAGFPALTAPRTGRVATGDLDGDGRQDVVATTSYWAVNAMASRNGTGYPMGNTGNGGSMGLVWYLNTSR